MFIECEFCGTITENKENCPNCGATLLAKNSIEARIRISQLQEKIRQLEFQQAITTLLLGNRIKPHGYAIS